MPPPVSRRPPTDVAFARLFAEHHDGVRRTLGCLGVPPSAVDDALQEVFVIVHRRIDEVNAAASPRAWIYGVARRVAWRHHRSSFRAAQRLAHVDPPPSPASPHAAIERDEAVSFLESFLAKLDGDQREVFVLAEVEGLSAPEISSIVDANLNTVYSRLRLARARFEQALERHRARARTEDRPWTTARPPR
jgi:RNA polymerase sigma-70 factor (ECF subfamily)